jgi:hypothetical protein
VGCVLTFHNRELAAIRRGPGYLDRVLVVEGGGQTISSFSVDMDLLFMLRVGSENRRPGVKVGD